MLLKRELNIIQGLKSWEDLLDQETIEVGITQEVTGSLN